MIFCKRYKIKSKILNNIEQKYSGKDESAYKFKEYASTVNDRNFGTPLSAFSPNSSKFPQSNLSNGRYQTRNNLGQASSVAKVTPAPMFKNNVVPKFKPMKRPEQTKMVKNSAGINNMKTNKANKNSNKQRNQRFLNSWEHDNNFAEEDIKEDINEEASNHDQLDRGKNTPLEEGSAVIRLLESISKFEEYDKNQPAGEDSSEDEDNFESSVQIDMIRKAQQNSRLGFHNRPYSPPFSQFSGKSK